MERKLTILLVEDDPTECNEIISYIERVNDVCLIGVTNNAKKALEHIHDSLPDVVILDLELHEGKGDGLTLLRDLNSTNKAIKPYILVTTQNPSIITHDAARQLGADFIMTKHQADYSAKKVVDFLIMLKQVLHTRKHDTTPSFAESPEEKTKRLHRRISSELDIIGISPKVVGYQYLIEAIQLIMERAVPNFCTIIGKKYSKTEASIERAMQNAINKAWKSGDTEDLYNYYTARINPEKGVPTLTEFIYYYANKFKNEH